MRRLVVQTLFLAGLLCCGQPSFGGTLYSNLGSGSNVYDPNNNYGVGGAYSPLFGGYNAWAFSFTPDTSGPVAQIDIPLWQYGGPDSVVLELLGDASGAPGTVLESWTVPVLPQVGMGITCCTLETVLGSGTSSLTAGTQYWIAVLPGTDSTWVAWPRNSTSALGTAYSDYGSGYLNDGSGWPLGAFEIRDTAATPEPASFALVAGALVIIARARWRHADLPARRSTFQRNLPLMRSSACHTNGICKRRFA